MKWKTATPTQTGVYWVRIADPEIGGYTIIYTTALWRPGGWRLKHPSMKVTHYAFIEEPCQLADNEEYADIYGRMTCVVQQEVKPDLSTPPARPKNWRQK